MKILNSLFPFTSILVYKKNIKQKVCQDHLFEKNMESKNVGAFLFLSKNLLKRIVATVATAS